MRRVLGQLAILFSWVKMKQIAAAPALKAKKGNCSSAHGKVMVKLKSIVYGVCDDIPAWPGRERGKAGEERGCFGLKTAQGLLEFECKNKIHRQRWVDSIRELLRQAGSNEQAEQSLELLKLE
ncbi:hypothetical protein ACLOJK_033289 [Asimina triloba]